MIEVAAQSSVFDKIRNKYYTGQQADAPTATQSQPNVYGDPVSLSTGSRMKYSDSPVTPPVAAQTPPPKPALQPAAGAASVAGQVPEGGPSTTAVPNTPNPAAEQGTLSPTAVSMAAAPQTGGMTYSQPSTGERMSDQQFQAMENAKDRAAQSGLQRAQDQATRAQAGQTAAAAGGSAMLATAGLPQAGQTTGAAMGGIPKTGTAPIQPVNPPVAPLPGTSPPIPAGGPGIQPVNPPLNPPAEGGGGMPKPPNNQGPEPTPGITPQPQPTPGADNTPPPSPTGQPPAEQPPGQNPGATGPLSNTDETIRSDAQKQIDYREKQQEQALASFLAARGISNSGAAVRGMALIAENAVAAWAGVEQNIAQTHQQQQFQKEMQDAAFKQQTGERLGTQDFDVLMLNKQFALQAQDRADQYTREYGVNPDTLQGGSKYNPQYPNGQPYTAREAAEMAADAQRKWATGERLSTQDWNMLMSDKNFQQQSSLMAQQITGQKDVNAANQQFQLLMTAGSTSAAQYGYEQDIKNGKQLSPTQMQQYNDLKTWNQYKDMIPDTAKEQIPGGSAEYDRLQKEFSGSYDPFDLSNKYAQMEANRELSGALISIWASSAGGAGYIDGVVNKTGLSGLLRLAQQIAGIRGGGY